MKKPYYIRSKYDLERIKILVKQLERNIKHMPFPENSFKWDYEYSSEKMAFDYTKEVIQKELNYAKGRIKLAKNKYPEIFL